MSLMSANVYICKLDDMVNKYNNTFDRTIKMKSANVKSSICIDFNKKIVRKVIKLKLMIMLEHQNIKMFL